MNLKYLIYLSIFFCISCKSQENKSIINDLKLNPSNDLQIVYVEQSKTYLDSLKSIHGEEDFYTIMDDNNYYLSIVNNYLDSLKIKYLRISRDTINSILYNRKKIDIKDNHYYLLKDSVFKETYPIDFKSTFEKVTNTKEKNKKENEVIIGNFLIYKNENSKGDKFLNIEKMENGKWKSYYEMPLFDYNITYLKEGQSLRINFNYSCNFLKILFQEVKGDLISNEYYIEDCNHQKNNKSLNNLKINDLELIDLLDVE